MSCAALDTQLAPYTDFPDRLDFDPETLETLKTDETRATGDLQRLTTEIAELDPQRDALILNPELVALAEDLDALEDLRARDRANALDLPRRQGSTAERGGDGARRPRSWRADGCDPHSLVPTPATWRRWRGPRPPAPRHQQPQQKRRRWPT